MADVHWSYSDDLKLYTREAKCSQEAEMALHLYVTEKEKTKHKLQAETWKYEPTILVYCPVSLYT